LAACGRGPLDRGGSTNQFEPNCDGEQQMRNARYLSGIVISLIAFPSLGADEHPLTVEVRRKIVKDAEQVVGTETKRLEEAPGDINALSRRGDAQFFLGRFRDALADYDAMVAEDSSQDAAHWRRGIACFYAGEYQRAAQQFERYHSFDNIDRENGIWKYLSQRRQLGRDEARRGLLKYEKDDREPFPDLFKLFAGTIEPAAILTRINTAELSESQREARRFYADLYIGLNHAVEDREAEALESLSRATTNRWPRQAGYGPNWMWHVGRLQWEMLHSKQSHPGAKR
jgi:lipoprotein NlpI